jgi:CRP/FNR family transcriptional regulator, cyclic AMP receptor protein
MYATPPDVGVLTCQVIRLLDIDPELAMRLREDDRAEARERLTLSTRTIATGEWALGDESPRTHPFGLVVLDGLLQRETALNGRMSIQLLGRGDLVLPAQSPSEFLEADVSWRAAVDTEVAILDDRVQASLALWPGLALGLLQRVAEQVTRLAIQTAIAQLPRVEDRLEATFWDLADRWGHVTPSGIHLPLQLTHEALARLVGGRRPTISLALTALAEREIVMRQPDGSWLIVAREPSLTARTVAEAPPRVTRTAPPEPPPVAAVHDAWEPETRAAVLASARRAGTFYVAAAERVESDRLRFEATRQRSRALREQAARERAERDSERDHRRPLILHVPPAPSAG